MAMFASLLPTALLAVLLALFCCIAPTEACSPHPQVKLGVFVNEARPLREDPDKVLARLDHYKCGQENRWKPSLSKYAIVDLEGGRLQEVVDSDHVDDMVLPPPTSLARPTGNFSLTVNAHVGTDIPPTATLTLLDNSMDQNTTFRLDIRPDGTEIVEIEEWMREHLLHSAWHFYSPAFGLIYVFYQIDYDASVTVTTINATNLRDTNIFYATGLPYAETHGKAHELVYDDVQILALGGRGADCIAQIFAYYNSTSVTLLAMSVQGNYLNVINSMSQASGNNNDTREDRFYAIQRNKVYDDPTITCSSDDANEWGTQSINETLIAEYLVSDPRTLLRQVTVNAQDLEDLFGSSSSSSSSFLSSAKLFSLKTLTFAVLYLLK